MLSHESYRSRLPLERGQEGLSYLAAGSGYNHSLKAHLLVPLLFRLPEWIAARQVLNRDFGNKGLEPPGALFHTVFLRRDVSENDQAFFLACRNCVAGVFNRFPFTRFSDHNHIDVRAIK